MHAIQVAVSACTAVLVIFVLRALSRYWKHGSRRVPLSVNYHFTRQCNYACKFCFHTAKTSHVTALDEAKRGLLLLREAGCVKLNFSGGEPFLEPKFLGELVEYCHETLRFESVSIVSNGSKITRSWMEKYGRHVDILAISCDSFVEETNRKIGRWAKRTDHIAQLKRIAQWCREYTVDFKINTVVNTVNKNEDMSSEIRELAPSRWKVFQCLLIAGENTGGKDLRDARSMIISSHDFEAFLARHADCRPVHESNALMRNSYLILDEYMRFLDCTGGAKIPSQSILEVGVAKALEASGFDDAAFYQRGGKYDWTKESNKGVKFDVNDW